MRAGSLLVIAALVGTSGACTTGQRTVGSTTPTTRNATSAPGSTATSAPQVIVIPTDDAGKPVVMVWMGEHYYSPAELTIPVGTTVMWRMLGQQEHDVWAFDGSFHSPTMGPGATFTHTFTKIGTFKYLCVPHSGDGMFGQVSVTPR